MMNRMLPTTAILLTLACSAPGDAVPAKPAEPFKPSLSLRPVAVHLAPSAAQAARLRLVIAGNEKELLPPVEATPGSILALMDAWNRAPCPQRRDLALGAFTPLTPSSPA